MRQSKVMRKFPVKFFSLLFAVALFPIIGKIGQLDNVNNERLRYIEKYKDIAIKEMERAGIPASIKLAQGILESRQGKSELAKKANNHFGMKCGSQWKGKTYYLKDDDVDPNGILIESCFRVYKSGEDSYRAHSEFLRDPRKAYRYGFLFRLDVTDYKRWALGLKKAGYATNPKYPDMLIKLIEEYELYIYDQMAPEDVLPPKLAETPDVITKNLIVINAVNISIAEENDTPVKVAERTGVSIKRILGYNDHISGASANLEKGTRIFLQPKRWSYRGEAKYHYVKKGETLFDISQLYAVTLSRLRWRNRYKEGEEPAMGTKIKLRGWRVSKTDAPAVRSMDEDMIAPATLPLLDMDQDGDLKFDLDAEEIDLDEIDFPDDSSSTVNDDHIHGDKTPALGESDTGSEDSITNDEDEFPTKGTEDDEDKEEADFVNKQYHSVLAGETLYRISKMYQTTVKEIKELNNLHSNILSIGQRLRVK